MRMMPEPGTSDLDRLDAWAKPQIADVQDRNPFSCNMLQRAGSHLYNLVISLFPMYDFRRFGT